MKQSIFIGIILGISFNLYSQSEKKENGKSLLDYQNYALENIGGRNFKTTIYEYDSLNNIVDVFIFEQKNVDIKLSLISKKIDHVTTFPYFTPKDSLIKEVEDEKFIYYSAITNFDNLNYYLKDLILRFNKNENQIDQIKGKLIIHGNNIWEGNYTYDELYLVEFEKVKEHFLPTKVGFYPIDDIGYKTPRLVQEIIYK